jgi:hypothetical protein
VPGGGIRIYRFEGALFQPKVPDMYGIDVFASRDFTFDESELPPAHYEPWISNIVINRETAADGRTVRLMRLSL